MKNFLQSLLNVLLIVVLGGFEKVHPGNREARKA